MNPEIEAALARLANTEVEVRPVTRGPDPHDGAYIELTLAALIRTSPPTPELLALVRAINGGERK